MVFNSIAFLVFFIVVFLLYWFACGRSNKWQNWLLLLASYFFYGYASLKIVPILLLVTIIFYFLGIGIGQGKEKQAHYYTILGVVLGVGFLLYFKYFNFFVGSFMNLLNAIGFHTNWHTMKIIMPLGISFFTFKLIAYVLDVRHRKIEPTRDFVAFATYISFFPCILSGPIDRPVFMKQLAQKRVFSYDQAVDGCRQFLWGLFKKMVIADNCALYVDSIFDNLTASTGSSILIASVLYVFQIYADFSGYSDMAIGVGKLLGLKISPNFKYPLFALNIADFWRRWHISLTGWMTDYVFMPLNLRLRNFGKWGMIVAIVVNFVIVGLWHGDNWNYCLYGLYHGLLFVPLILSGSFYKNPKLHKDATIPNFVELCKMCITFILVLFGLLIFRCPDFHDLYSSLLHVFSNSLWATPFIYKKNHAMLVACISICIMLFVEWRNRNQEYGMSMQYINKRYLRLIIYNLLIISVFVFGVSQQKFIYFQF